MAQATLPKLLPALRRLARPSSAMRVLWLTAALLHAWLIARRIGAGELATVFDWLKAVLCLAGVGYASLKFWQISTIFDANPRRALVFCLLLVLGHGLINAPEPMALSGPAPAAVGTMLAVLPTMALAAAAITIATRRRRLLGFGPHPQAGLPAAVHSRIERPAPLAGGSLSFVPNIMRRPPPASR